MRKGLRQKVDYQIKGLPIKVHKFVGYPEEIISPPHFHDFELEIQFIKEGTGYYFIKNKKYKIEKGKVFIIHKKDLHYFISSKERSKIEKITLMIKKDILCENAKIFNPLFKCETLHQVYLKERDFLISELLLEEIWENIKKVKKLKDFKVLLKLNLSKFFHILKTNFENSKFYKKETMDPRILKAIEFINKNYNKKISEDEVSREIGLSKYYFAHLFKKITGVSFKKYLIEKRLFESEKLLKLTNLKLQWISLRCGFPSLSLFLREFKKKFKITPTQLRKLTGKYT